MLVWITVQFFNELLNSKSLHMQRFLWKNSLYIKFMVLWKTLSNVKELNRNLWKTKQNYGKTPIIGICKH